MGQIGKPHGLQGEVYVARISDDPRRFEVGARLQHEDGRELVVSSARPHRDRFLMAFEGATSRDAAEGLKGALYISTEEARSLDADEYWPHDLIGCSVRNADGAEIGEVVEVVSNPAQELLVISTAAGERFIPMVKEMIRDVDLTERRIVVAAPEGLLD